jgi:hypothetical protein
MAGNASGAKNNTRHQLRVYKIVIFGDEAERIHALTQIIATPYVSVVINTGEEMDVKTISLLKRSNLVNWATKNLKLERSHIRKKTIN